MSDIYRKAKVYIGDMFAGIIQENDKGYLFTYDEKYLSSDCALPVSLTLPLSSSPYESNVLFPFFDGIIPEGWLYEQVIHNWKINRNDRFGVLLLACADCVGDVSIKAYE